MIPMELITAAGSAPNYRAYFVAGFQVSGVKINLEPALREHDWAHLSCYCDYGHAEKYLRLADHTSQLVSGPGARFAQEELEVFVEFGQQNLVAD